MILTATHKLRPGQIVATRLGRVCLLDRHERIDVDGRTVIWFDSASLHQPRNAVIVQGTAEIFWWVIEPPTADTRPDRAASAAEAEKR